MRAIRVLGWLWGLLFGLIFAPWLVALTGIPVWGVLLICAAIGRYVTRYDFQEDLFYTLWVSLAAVFVIALIVAVTMLLYVTG
ncbi:hypothetical protein BCL32_1001 [Rhizobium mongolense USDA 1844]|nr:hypothetical protein BCL32_1001 [Rhizobium mongolense USDA 1844]